MKTHVTTELVELRAVQAQARRDEVFGGMSDTERQMYDVRAARISQLDKQTAEIAPYEADLRRLPTP